MGGHRSLLMGMVWVWVFEGKCWALLSCKQVLSADVYSLWGSLQGFWETSRARAPGLVRRSRVPSLGVRSESRLCNSLFRASRVGHCKREESRSAPIAPSSALPTLRLASSQLGHPRDSLHKFNLLSSRQVKAHLSTPILMH